MRLSKTVWKLLALTCGFRHAEITGLKVRDYNAARGTLDVRRTVYNNAVGTPKSRRGRDVPSSYPGLLRMHSAAIRKVWLAMLGCSRMVQAILSATTRSLPDSGDHFYSVWGYGTRTSILADIT
jgi:integrase